jgi:hypothetical protein
LSPIPKPINRAIAHQSRKITSNSYDRTLNQRLDPPHFIPTAPQTPKLKIFVIKLKEKIMSRRNGTTAEPKVQAVEVEGTAFSNGFDNYEINGITFTGKPRQYRADCQSGQFKIGGAKMLGKILNLEILAFRKSKMNYSAMTSKLG